MITRQSFGGTLKLRDEMRDLLLRMPEGTCYLIAEWKQEDQLPQWTTGGTSFSWDKEKFVAELLAEADAWEGDTTARARIEAERDQQMYRDVDFHRFKVITNAVDRMKDHIDSIGSPAVAFYFSPAGWPESTEFFFNRPQPSSLLRVLAAALQATQEGAPK